MQPSVELRFVGLDANAAAIAAAKQQEGGGDPRIDFRVHKLGNVLPFENASLDVVYSNNLIECLPDRSAFALEVARVLRPGGWAVMAHWDWDSQVYDSQDKELVRRLVSSYADWRQDWMDYADGWMGRRLWGSFHVTHHFDGSIHARVMTNTEYAAPWYGYARAQDLGALVSQGLATREDYDRFVAEQKELDAQGRYFYSITGFAFVGQRITS